MPSLPFRVLQRLDLPLTEMVCGRIGFIHDAFLPFPYEVGESLPRDGRDLVLLLGKKRQADCLKEVGEYAGRVVLVFAMGDPGMQTADLSGKPGLPPNVVAAFGVNNELGDRRAISLPLGPRSSNLRALQFVRQNRRRPRDGLLYANFALNDRYYRPDRKTGTSHIRHRLFGQLQGCSWVDLDISEDHRTELVDLIDYYSQLAAHKFVLSPEGKGVDCYRTWEAIYLGAIPIVMVSAVTSAFARLPILFTHDYSELSEAYLERRWHEMSSRSFEIDRLLKSWYLHRFLDAVSVLEDPDFFCWQVDGSPHGSFVNSLKTSSRSASRVLVETPTPPFVGGEGLMTPDAWNVSEHLRLQRTGGSLHLVVDGDGRAVAAIPAHTIRGGRFCLTGRIRPENGLSHPLSVRAEAGRDVIAAVDVDGSDENLRLDFIARSDRTVLVIQAPQGATRTSWLLEDLSLRANV